MPSASLLRSRHRSSACEVAYLSRAVRGACLRAREAARLAVDAHAGVLEAQRAADRTGKHPRSATAVSNDSSDTIMVCDGTCAGTELGDCSHAVNAVPQQEHPSLWRCVLAALRDEPLPPSLSKEQPVVREDYAYVIVTLDTETREVLRVGIYSCSAMSLTMASRHEDFIDARAVSSRRSRRFPSTSGCSTSCQSKIARTHDDHQTEASRGQSLERSYLG